MNDNALVIETPNYTATAESFRIFISKKGASPTEKKGSFPVYIRRIILGCKRSGAEYRFPATTRKGQTTFGDSRETADVIKPRYFPAQMSAELARLVGADNAKILVGHALA